MKKLNRRNFIRKSSAATAGILAASPVINTFANMKRPNDTINIAVIGIRSRGKDHIRALAKVPDVKIA
ncbi:MAG TPA: twin-arginine translocation signal domain-containing protein, partial [Cyclobacteriaceae bacterium]|nr:twin-arginine translocation signal domain-containing protein [Cyclobacteriaceae bacterium]